MRLIDADALIPLIKMGEMNTYDDLGRGRNGGIGYAISRINQMPTIEERKKGKWIEENRRPKSSMFYCSVCHRTAYDPQPNRKSGWTKRCRYDFCPNCGADMRGEENER